MSALIATPAYGGQVTVAYMRSVLGIMHYCAERGFDVDLLLTEGESHVTRARNNLCATFLEHSDADHIVFIDADIEIAPADFYEIATADGVRGAAVACKTPDHSETLSVWADGSRPTRAQLVGGIHEVEFLGSAVLAISRHVLEQLRDEGHAPEYEDDIVGKGWWFFWDGVVDKVVMTEDYGFCISCNKAEIPIKCHGDVTVKHYGNSYWSA